MSNEVVVEIKTDKGTVTKTVVWSELDLEELKFFYLDLGFEAARLEYKEREGWDPVWFKRPPTFEELDWWHEWKKENKGEEIPQYWLDVRQEKQGNPNFEF
jgi:hypothetical protein